MVLQIMQRKVDLFKAGNFLKSAKPNFKIDGRST